jgi:hypothetical protein
LEPAARRIGAFVPYAVATRLELDEPEAFRERTQRKGFT